MAIDLVFLTRVVDAYEGHDVAFIDLPGAFLHMLPDKKIIVTLRGEQCKLECLINHELYWKFVCHDKKEIQCCTLSSTNLFMGWWDLHYLLQEAKEGIRRVEHGDKPIWHVHVQQGNIKWTPAHHAMACRWPENLLQRQVGSNQTNLLPEMVTKWPYIEEGKGSTLGCSSTSLSQGCSR